MLTTTPTSRTQCRIFFVELGCQLASKEGPEIGVDSHIVLRSYPIYRADGFFFNSTESIECIISGCSSKEDIKQNPDILYYKLDSVYDTLSATQSSTSPDRSRGPGFHRTASAPEGVPPTLVEAATVGPQERSMFFGATENKGGVERGEKKNFREYHIRNP